LYRAQRANPKLGERITLKIGLFCGYSYSYDCVDTLLRRIDVQREDVKAFDGWREGKDYPGAFSALLRDGRTSRLSYVREHSIDVAHFALFRCFLCIDGLNQLADISLGDSPGSVEKTTFIISRTPRGDSMLNSARDDGHISFSLLPPKEALRKGIVPFMVREKRYKPLSAIEWLSRRGVPVPCWDAEYSGISWFDRLNATARIRLVRFVRRPKVTSFLQVHPWLMEITGGLVYRLDLNPVAVATRTIYGLIQSRPPLARKVNSALSTALYAKSQIMMAFRRW
jgi:hypothetical protein